MTFASLHEQLFFEALRIRRAEERIIEIYPTECQTYRYQEHVGTGCDHDVGYRSRVPLEEWQANDPLLNDSALVAAFDPVIREEIDDAVQFAEESPWPGPEHLLADVA